MKVAALIPARLSSRRLPGKNWRCIGGKALWQHAVDHAKESGVCEIVAISSDDSRILQYDHGCIAIDQPQFSQTYNVMQEVVKHADGELLRFGYDVDAICLLQPTSPLRLPQDIAAAVGMLGASIDSVVSVTQGADDIAFQVRHAGRLEKIPPIVVPNGAIFLIKTATLRTGGHWYGPYAYAYQMPKDRSIDIDNELDLEMAQLAWAKLYERASG